MSQSAAQKNASRFIGEAIPRKRDLKRSPTKAELAFRELLKDMRISHQFQKLVFADNRYFIMDFVIKMGPNMPRFIIEIDGAVHDRQRDYDRMRTWIIENTLAYRNFKVMRLTNDQVFGGGAIEFLKTHYPRPYERWARKKGKAA